MTAISNNFGAFNALANLQRAEQGQAAIFDRLSSGEKLRQSSDAPDRYATSNQLRSEVKALREVRKTSFEGINMIQVADATLGEAVNLIYRAMELAEWSASDTLGPDGGALKQARDNEYQEILNDLDALNNNTRVNDQDVFGAAGQSLVINLDTEVTSTSDQITVTTQPFSSVTLALAGTDVTTKANADVVLSQLRPALENMTRQQASLGTWHQHLERNITNLNDRIDANLAQESYIRDADIAEETVKLTSLQIQSQSGVAAIAQANLSSEAVFQLLS